jgi:predicted DNA-binding transcriptional regulator YafY
MNRTDRLLAIVLELQAKGWQRAEDLAATFEISKRTIYRDMEALAESGVPVVSSPGQGYSLVEGYFLPPVHFSTDEAIMLILGADVMAKSFDAQYRAAARSAASKIQAVLPDRSRAEVDDLQTAMRFIPMNPVDGDAKPQLLQQIRRAVIERKTVRMEYHTRFTEDIAGAKTRRDANPYGLIHLDRTWYMVAYCHLRHDIRHFRLDRIDRLQVLEKSFVRPADFDIGPSPNDQRGIIVRALFSPEVSRWVQEERLFYKIAQEERSDGLLMTFSIRQETDLVQWLLGWGRHVRVLEPQSVIDLMLQETQAILSRYQPALP